jgi:hypothetical protein
MEHFGFRREDRKRFSYRSRNRTQIAMLLIYFNESSKILTQCKGGLFLGFL